MLNVSELSGPANLNLKRVFYQLLFFNSVFIFGATLFAQNETLSAIQARIAREYQIVGPMPAHFGQNQDERNILATTIRVGNRIQIIDYASLVNDFKGNRIQDEGITQTIYPNTDFENNLLKASFAVSHAPEAARCKAFDRNGKEISVKNPVVVGQYLSVSVADVERYRTPCENAPAVFLVEANHTHPMHDMYFGPNLSRVFYRPLSAKDVSLAKGRSSRIRGIYHREKAILANGYFYTATFLNGEEVRDPFL